MAPANDEIVQLKATIGALRDELDRNKIAYEAKKQELKRAAHDEVKQLQQMIEALRKQLEVCYEK